MFKKEKEQLEELQIKRLNLIHQRDRDPDIISLKLENKITKIQNKMASLNKLKEKEKNLNAIWIGIPPTGEFDNLKIWAKYNPDYKIHIWTDSTHILAHKLDSIISDKGKDIDTEANLKDDFYYNYQLKNSKRIFDENAKEFLIKKGYASESEINNWIKEGKEKIVQEKNEIQKYTNNQVILHDINKEKNVFPNERYYNGYLNTLEHLQICAGASDRLRYAVLNAFGGAYLDTDIGPNFDLTEIEKNSKLINSINQLKWNPTAANKPLAIDKKVKIVMSQIILLDKINQLNDENLTAFAHKWDNMLQGNYAENITTFQNIAQQYKDMNLNLKPKMNLSDIQIDNSLRFISPVILERDGRHVPNAFLLTKKNSKVLQDMMKNIEITDDALKDMKTNEKLINKFSMIILHTGPGNLNHTLKTHDQHYMSQYLKLESDIINNHNLNSYDSSWAKTKHTDAIFNPKELKRRFLVTPADLHYKEIEHDLSL